MRSLRLAISLAVLCLPAVPAAAQADTSFESGDVTGLISAQGDDLAYAAPTSGDAVRLRMGFGAAAANVPVRPASGFFGLDLGTDSRGRSTLIYSRCNRTGRRCDLFTYRLGARRERKLRSLSRSACIERNPHLVNGTVVFVRERRRSRRRRLRCAAGIYRKRPGRRLRRISGLAPFDVDFDGRRVVFVRTTSRDDGAGGSSGRDQIRVFRPGRRSILLAEGTWSSDRGGNSGTFLKLPTLAGGRAYWVRSGQQLAPDAPEVNDVVRRNADGSGTEEVLDRSGRLWVDTSGNRTDAALGGVAVAGDRLYYAYANQRIGLVAGAPVFR